MDLFAPIKRALAEQKYETPTPIQAQTIPPAIEGQDILGCAQTGTGKTAAFALPILDYLGHNEPKTAAHRPIALIMAPTRELAIQIDESFRVYGKYMKVRRALVYGGVGQGSQVESLKRRADVLVATPGRLLDLMEQGHIDLRDVEIFVLDEADRMLDMGFLPALKKIIAKLPKERQSLFFSATMPPNIRDLSERLLFNPVSVNVTPKRSVSVAQIKQSVRMVDRSNKLALLRNVLADAAVERAIVFTRTKRGANNLARKLEKAGLFSAAIHGNKSQSARQKALEAFRRKQVSVLVATDVAARGIDIDGVTHVINFDMPVEAESYVHRIGRTGRAGAEGVAISFCTDDERSELHSIERLIGQKILRTEKKQSEVDAQSAKNSQSEGHRSPNVEKQRRQPGAKISAQGKRRFGSGKKNKRRTGKPSSRTAVAARG
ncbi:MAG: DEAD/DEAH box helicase [Planctomycetaceae bacterium]|nr:DEAD/DEAH box helicase [Planctomycetaceae bacterium]